jgi:NAD(P)-dependent dehydrogenase (short-subunit alcohol dehydrogenase family)
VSGHYPRLAVVTGADSGIGQATATLLAAEGFDLGLTCHEDTEGVRATAQEIETRGQRCFVEPTRPRRTRGPSWNGSPTGSAVSASS